MRQKVDYALPHDAIYPCQILSKSVQQYRREKIANNPGWFRIDNIKYEFCIQKVSQQINIPHEVL